MRDRRDAYPRRRQRGYPEGFPMPLGSTDALFIPPAFSGPRGMPLIGTFPVAAEPACRASSAEPPCHANEAAGQAATTKSAKATFTEVFDMRKRYLDPLETPKA